MTRAGARRRVVRQVGALATAGALLTAFSANASAVEPTEGTPSYLEQRAMGDAKGRGDQANDIAKHLEERGWTGAPIKQQHQADLAAGITIKQTQKDCIAYVGVQIPPPYDCNDVPEHVMDNFKGTMFPQGEPLAYEKRGNRAIYPFKNDARTLVVQKEQGSSQRFIAIFEDNDRRTPTYMDFKVDLPRGYYLATDSGDDNIPVFRYTNPKNRSLSYDVGGMVAPWATDARDRTVAATWEYVDENTLRLQVAGQQTVDGHEITYPLTADPWLSYGWDWWPNPGIRYEVHFSYNEALEVAETLDDIDQFVYMMCGYLTATPIGWLIGPPCMFVANSYFESFDELFTEAAYNFCGVVIEFSGDAYPREWYLECA